MKSGSRGVACAVPRASVFGHGGVPCRMPSSAGGGLVRSMCSCRGAAIVWRVAN